ncbi:hypothetical protein [Streptomyces melanogenes]|uniref:hypothetical protein n=1 Tax=Streptomyces melanogenes TaxID=67326 RepID=UPI003787FECA
MPDRWLCWTTSIPVTACTVALLLEAFGRARALERVDADIAEYECRGYARPCTVT